MRRLSGPCSPCYGAAVRALLGMRPPKGPPVRRGPSLGTAQSKKRMPRSPSPPASPSRPPKSSVGTASSDAVRRPTPKVASKKSVGSKQKTGVGLTVKKTKVHIGGQKGASCKPSASRQSAKSLSAPKKSSDKKKITLKKNTSSGKSSREPNQLKFSSAPVTGLLLEHSSEKCSDQKLNTKKPVSLCTTEVSKSMSPKIVQKRSPPSSKAAGVVIDGQTKSAHKKINSKSLPEDTNVDVRLDPSDSKPNSPKPSNKKTGPHVKSLPDKAHYGDGSDVHREVKTSHKIPPKKRLVEHSEKEKQVQKNPKRSTSGALEVEPKQVKASNRRENSASPSRKKPQKQKAINQRAPKRDSDDDGKGVKHALDKKLENASKKSSKEATSKKGKRESSATKTSAVGSDGSTEFDREQDSHLHKAVIKRKKKSSGDIEKLFESVVKDDAKKASLPKALAEKKSPPASVSDALIPDGSSRKILSPSSPIRPLRDEDKVVPLSDDDVPSSDKKKAVSKRRQGRNSPAHASDYEYCDDVTKLSKGHLYPNGLVGRIVPKPISDLISCAAQHLPKKMKLDPCSTLKSKVSLNHSVTIKKTKWNDTTVTKVSRREEISNVEQKRKDVQKMSDRAASTVMAAKEKLAQWKAMVESDAATTASHRKSISSEDDDLPLQCLRKDATVVEVSNSESTDFFSSFKIDSHFSLMSRMGGRLSSVPHKKRPYAAKLESKTSSRNSDDDGKKVSTKVSEERISAKKPTKDIYEFGLSSSDHGMSDSSVKRIPLEKRKKKKRGNREPKRQASPQRAQDSASGSDTDSKARRLRLFGFWSGPKRHRVASLNALAKVHCMFENENRPAFLGGYVTAKEKKDKERGKPSSSKQQQPRQSSKTRSKSRVKSTEKDQSKKVDSTDDEASQSEDDPPSPAITTRALRTGHGIRGAGKHWDVNTVSSSSSSAPPSSSSSGSEDETHSDVDADARSRLSKDAKDGKDQKSGKASKEQAARSKDRAPRRKKKEPSMDLKDMVVRKRMASLNATAIMAASYSVEKRTTTTKDSTTTEEKQTTTTVVAQLPPEVRPATPSPVLDDVDKAKALVQFTDGSKPESKRDIVVPDELIDFISSPDGRHTLILNRDDVTITGVYVRNSTHSLTHSTHAEGFCSIAGLEYRISSTSHTKTEATAVTTEVINMTPSRSEAQQNNSYTPLVALSSMRPPGPVLLALPPHRHPAPPHAGYPVEQPVYHQGESSDQEDAMKASSFGSGCIETGVGHNQFNNLLVVMNVPPVHTSTMKRAERRIAPAILKTARDSCKAAILEEKVATLSVSSRSSSQDQDSSSSEGDLDCSGVVDDQVEHEVELIGQYDYGWDQRGSGHSYNSHSGRGAVIGHFTKKVLSFKTLSRTCALCRAGRKPDEHNCSKNYEGSSKGMEPKAAVDLILNNPDFEEANVRVGTLVADEDSSTIAALRHASPKPIKKWIDRNHCLNKVKSKFYLLRPRFKFLNTEVILYIMKCITATTVQNVGNVEGLKLGLKNVVKHMFNEHDGCGEWCKAKDNESYNFRRLPGGKPFTCEVWRTAFEEIIETLCLKAEELAPGGVSLHNESFNQMCVSRAPKSRFYSSSPANNLRVSAAVCKKNLGATHVLDINANASLSPGGITAKYREKLKEKQEERFKNQQTIQYKRRRLFNKNKKSSIAASASRKEGFTYVSGTANTMERAAEATEVSCWVPPDVPRDENCKAVIVDIETTGFGADACILQVAAKTASESFCAYILPDKPIHPKASEKTGFTVFEEQLFYRDMPVATEDSNEVASNFIFFLQSVAPQVVLVGHNIIRFDLPQLVKWLKKFDLVPAFCDIVYGATDTMPLLKQGKVQKQEELARQFLTDPAWKDIINGAHNAQSDCVVLEGLLLHFNIGEETLQERAVVMKDFFEKQAKVHRKKANIETLRPLEGVVSKCMLGKLAENGVTIRELEIAFSAHGKTGVDVALGIQLNGEARVTKSKKILGKISEFIEARLTEQRRKKRPLPTTPLPSPGLPSATLPTFTF